MYRLIVVLAFLASTLNAFSQLTAPGRDWAGITAYRYSDEQDSIFVFYSATGILKCTHTTGNPSTFSWYRYNPNVSNVANRFELLQVVTGETSSERLDLAEGGYRVVVVDDADSTEIFTAWLFTDDVALSRVDFDNECQFLELTAVASPSSYYIEYNRFVYYDISRTTNQPEVDTYGKAYFYDITWSASESRVTFTPSSALKQVIESPAPLYPSSYSVEITNVFGKKMTAETPPIGAIAAKADQKVQVDEDGTWADYDSYANYEALLGLRLESLSSNADSIYWLLSKLSTVDYDDMYRVIWRDSSLFATRVEAFPPKQLMDPGYFKVKHVVVNTSTGCMDSVEVEIAVDSSKIKPDAIPNVFTPNGDGVNDRFKFVDSDENIKSIKSFTIRILSRTGKLIYKYSGNPKEWEGWNGKIDGTGADAAEGVYYFIVEAKGWDGREFDYGPYKGFLHLFRGDK